MSRLWILGAGHGVETKGKRSPGKKFPNDGKLGVVEYEFNRDVVRRIEEALNILDIPVHVICQDDHATPLGDRVKIVNTMAEAWEGNAFYISVHGNAAGKGGWSSARGFRVFRYGDFKDQEEYFAMRMCEHVKNQVPDWTHNVKVKEGGFYVIKKPDDVPSVLTENGFMTSKLDAAFMASEEGRDRIAKYHVGAILDFEEKYS